MPLVLRTIGIRDYSVIEDGQKIGRIRFADERLPGVWIWNIQVHLPGNIGMGSVKDLETAKADFKAAWEALRAKHTEEEFAKAFASMNIRDRG